MEKIRDCLWFPGDARSLCQGMDPCNSDANQKTFFTDLKIKFLHQFVVYPEQLGNLFFMLPLSDISVFPLMFGLVANLPMSIFVLSRKNVFTNATDYVIFVFFCFFFFFRILVFFSFWEMLNFNFCKRYEFSVF